MPRPTAIRSSLASVRRLCAAPALALVLGLANGFAGPAFAQDKEVDLRLSLWVPPAHPLTGSAKAWADDIAKDSNGSIKITIFPSEQLGKAFDHYDMARDDIADITYVNPGYQPGRFPIIAIGQMPFTFGDARKGTAALELLVSQIRAHGDEGHPFLPRLHSRSRRAARAARRSSCRRT